MALKDILNQFTQDVKEVAKNVTDKANDTIEITKLSAKISSEEAQVATYLKDLGTAVLDKIQSGELKDEAFDEIVGKINNSKDLIAVLQGKIDEIKAAAEAKVEEVQEAVEEKVEEVKETVEDVKEAVEDKVEDVVETVEENFDVLKGAAEEVHEEVEEKVEEVKAVVEDVPATKICPLCGVEVDADAAVCPICGYEFE